MNTSYEFIDTHGKSIVNALAVCISVTLLIGALALLTDTAHVGNAALYSNAASQVLSQP